MIERPVFVVAPPRSGATALFRSLAEAPGVFSASVPILDGIFELQPENREWDSNRLIAADIQPRAVEDLRGRLKGGLVDSSGNRPGIDATGLRWVDGQPRNALRVPFLAGISPDAQFVYIHRDPAETIPAMLRVWEGGGRVSYSELPGWEGPPWSLPLVPGWRELAGKPLPEIVTEQWVRLTGTLLDDLETLSPERWCVTDFKALLNDPQRELERICEFVALEASEDVTRPLRSLRDQLAVSGERDEEAPEELRDLLPRTEKLAERSRELLARPTAPPRTAKWSAPADSPLRSVYTQNFPEFLNQLGSSLLVSTYQTRKADLRPLRRRPAQHALPGLPPPDGARGRRRAESRSAPAPRCSTTGTSPRWRSKVEPQGKHDACFLPRNKHFTGDIRIHEVAFAQGRALARGHELLLPGDPGRGAQLRARAGSRPSSRSSPPRTAATSTASA